MISSSGRRARKQITLLVDSGEARKQKFQEKKRLWNEIQLLAICRGIPMTSQAKPEFKETRLPFTMNLNVSKRKQPFFTMNLNVSKRNQNKLDQSVLRQVGAIIQQQQQELVPKSLYKKDRSRRRGQLPGKRSANGSVWSSREVEFGAYAPSRYELGQGIEQYCSCLYAHSSY